MSDFIKEINELKAKVRTMDARIKELECGPIDEDEGEWDTGGLSINEYMEIKLIAHARARGDKGPLKARQRAAREREKANGRC